MPLKTSGPGPLSVVCFRCGEDGNYAPSELQTTEAIEDIPSTYPERTAVSNSPRKPLWKIHPSYRAVFGVGYIEDRPLAAAIVGRIITSWADIEVQCARLLAELLNTNIPAAAAVFGALRSSRAQHDALSAAAKIVLDIKDFQLFNAHMLRRETLEKGRNDLAHGCFGVCANIPDDVIWVDQTDFLLFSAKRPPSPSEIEEFRKKQFIYELGTLEKIAQDIHEFYHQLGFFTGYLRLRHSGLHPPDAPRQRYNQLCNQPHIREALDRVLKSKRV